MECSVAEAIGSTPFHDIERGFHAEHFELLPQETTIMPSFNDGECGDDSSDEEL